MNEQLDELKRFREQLIHFDMALRRSMNDLKKSHDKVAPLWRDEMRKEYDRQWEPLLTTLQAYDKVDGPRYVEFLSIKIHSLEQYLFGR